MTDIFVSYASEDRARIKPLVEHLQSLGWSVWWDRELVAGPSFDEKIEAAIQDAACVVVAWSLSAIASKWVRAEANEGLERGILVPLLLDDVRPPLVFRASHAANLIGWPDRMPETELHALITGIQDVVGTTPQQRRVIDAEISSRSIAVLRFADMSSQRDQEPLCEGIADEILNRLARIRDLKVIARTSSFLFDPNHANVREIGQRLSVRHLLEGSVHTSGKQVRITARLVECDGESNLWSESYTRELTDLFTLYDEVADAIAQALDLAISGNRFSAAAAPTLNEEAFRLVMQARFKLEDSENPRSLLPLVERAIALDPDYAEAELTLAQIYFTLGEYSHELPEPVVRTALGCVQRALLLDPDLPEAHELLGSIRAYLDLDWSLAAESWKQGDRLRGYAKKYNRLCMAGYYEASERSCRHAMTRDPLNILPRLWLGRSLDRLGRIDEATVEYQEALALQPGNLSLVNDVLDHRLNFAQEIEHARQFLNETQYSGAAMPWMQARMARAEGDSEPLRSLVERWVAGRNTRYVTAQVIEETYYDLGDYGAHIHWFDVRVRERANLYFLPFTFRSRPDYWDRLTDWALDDPSQIRSRLMLINEHRARIDRITEKLVLPHDYARF